jgi:hypothetical protein
MLANKHTMLAGWLAGWLAFGTKALFLFFTETLLLSVSLGVLIP